MPILTLLLICRLVDSPGISDVPKPHAPEPVNRSVVDAMRQAWQLAGRGISSREAGVLVVEEPDGGYRAEVVFDSDTHLHVRFNVVPGTVAIMHTHPNRFGAPPSVQDRKNADLLGIPTFTLTNRGMWMYDPETKQTSRLRLMLSWLDPSGWSQSCNGAVAPGGG